MRFIPRVFVMASSIFVLGAVELPGQAYGKELQDDSLAQGVIAEADNIDISSFDSYYKELSYDQALQLVLGLNPQVKAAVFEIEAARTGEITAGISPELELEFEMEEITDDGFDNIEAAVVLSKTIEMGDKLAIRKNVAETLRLLTENSYHQLVQSITAEVSASYYGVVIAQEKLKLAEEKMQTASETRDLIKKQFDLGMGTVTDNAHADADYFNARQLVRQAVFELDQAKAELASHWIDTEIQFDTVSAAIDQVEKPIEWPAVKILAQSSPAYKQLALENELGKSEIELEYAESVNDFSIAGGVQYFNEPDEHAYIVGFSLPLSSGRKNRAAIGRASYNQLAIVQKNRALRARYEYELRSCYKRWKNAYETITGIRDNIIPSAESVYSSAKKEYQQGKISYLNLLEAREVLFESRNEYLDALAEYYSSRSEVISLAGHGD